MEKFEKMMYEGQYEAILEITKDSKALDELFYRLKALVGLERFNEALTIINDYKNEFNMILNKRKELLVIHMFILFRMDDVFKIYNELEYYDSLPYEDYEFEQLLKEYKEKLLKNSSIKKNQNPIDKLDLIEKVLLNPDDVDNVVQHIDMLREYDVNRIMPTIRKFLRSDFDEMARTYMLLMLVSKESYEEVEFHKNGIEYNLIPYDLDKPFENDYHQDVVQRIKEYSESPSITNMAMNSLAIYTLNIYPDDIFDFDKNDIVVAFLEVAAQLLGDISAQQRKLSNLTFNRKIVDALKEDIESYMKTKQ